MATPLQTVIFPLKYCVPLTFLKEEYSPIMGSHEKQSKPMQT